LLELSSLFARWHATHNVIFAPKRGRKMLFDVSNNLAYELNPLI